MRNLVSDNQGRETARLARNVGLGRDLFQVALTDGTMHRILCAFHDGLPITIGPTVEYPDWVREHLTPKLEALTIRNPGKVELWLDPRQTSGNLPTGHKVYAAIKASGFLERSLSLGDLKWYEQHLDQIPADFHGKLIYGWASVVRVSDGSLFAPFLDCYADRPYVRWYRLVSKRGKNELAGLRKPAQTGK